MPLDADTAPTDAPVKNTHGGARPGAGGPRGPRPETVARLARLREIAALDAHGEDVSGLSNLDIVQIQIWRLWSQGECKAASDLALRLLPYQHARTPSVSITRIERVTEAEAPHPGAAPSEAEAEPVPSRPHPPTPRPPEVRKPKQYDRHIERKLDAWVLREVIRRGDNPDSPTEVPPFWREEVDSRLRQGS